MAGSPDAGQLTASRSTGGSVLSDFAGVAGTTDGRAAAELGVGPVVVVVGLVVVGGTVVVSSVGDADPDCRAAARDVSLSGLRSTPVNANATPRATTPAATAATMRRRLRGEGGSRPASSVTAS